MSVWSEGFGIAPFLCHWVFYPPITPLPRSIPYTGVKPGTASARSVSVKDVKHVIFSVQRIRVRALSRGESVLYFAKPGRLRQKNAFALGKRMQASFKLLCHRHWQRSRQKKHSAAQNRLLKDRL